MTKTIRISDEVWGELQRVKSLIAARRKKKTNYDVVVLELIAAFDRPFVEDAGGY